MAFWGLELKPGKPRTHTFDEARGRLRISQATLGNGEGSGKSVVQCNVGERSPVLLCVLLPGSTESLHLELEFEEADEVIFSVLGSRSVYLTGYFVRLNHRSFARSDDTESYGVDIQNTPTRSLNSDDEEYGGSFINDEELHFSPESPVLCFDEGFDEVTLRTAGKDRGKRVKKKLMVIESDSDGNDGVHGSDSDGNDGVHGSDTKLNVDPLDISDKIERVPQSPFDEEGAVNNVKNELPKQVGSSEKVMVSSQEEIRGNNTSGTPINQNLPMINGEDQMQSLDLVTQSPLDKEGAEVNNVKNEHQIQVWSSEKIMDSSLEEVCGSNTSGAPINHNVPMINEEDQMQSLDLVSQLPLDEEAAEVETELQKQVGSSEKIMDSSQEEVRGSNTSEAPINQNLPMINGEDQMQSLDLVTQSPLDEGAEVINVENELPKQVVSSEKIMVTCQKEIRDFNTREAIINMIKVEDQMESLNLAKTKNKRKKRSSTDKTSNVQSDNEHPSVPSGHKELEIDSSANLTVGEDHIEHGQKSKKRRNELLEGELTQGTEEKIQDMHADGMMEHLPVASGECEQQNSEETRMENFDSLKIVLKEDELIQEAGNQKDQIDRNISTLTEFEASDGRLGKKISKKRKKTRGNKELNTSLIQMSDNQEDEDQSAKSVPRNLSTLPNGLTIEELESGPQGGKVAALGKRVKIRYTGKLKENDHVFDSSVTCKFQLGDKEYIDGLTIGIDGMHVGDKRRLIIPPSLGFGETGTGNDIPPNSWLIYDVELVSVRK